MSTQLHYASPYRELESMDATELARVFGEDHELARGALSALSVPESYGTSGALYVTHAPTFVASRDASTRETVNLETAERWTLERFGDVVSLHGDACSDPAACSCDTDAFSGRSRSWLVGYVDELAVRPFARDASGTWIITDAWRYVCSLAEDARDGGSLDEDETYARERDELVTYLRSELGDTWSLAVVDMIHETTSMDELSSDDIAAAVRELVTDESARVRDHERLRLVGHGQLTLSGDVVTVPFVTDPAAVAELAELYASALHYYDGPGCAEDDGLAELVRYAERHGHDCYEARDLVDELAPIGPA